MSRQADRPSDGERSRSSSADAGEVRTRDRENPVVRWFLLDGNRSVLLVGTSVLTSVGLVVLGGLGVIGVTDASLVSSLFTSAITGVFTLVSITTSINQVVLSRVIGSPASIEERINSVHEYRTTVEDMSARATVSPTEPAAFLELVTRILRERATTLRETFRGSHDPRHRRQVDDLVDTLHALSDNVDEHVGSDSTDLFHLLSPILNNTYSKHRNTVRRIRANAEDLSEEERRALDGVAEVIDEINRTRHYFKTLYLHEELADASRLILATGAPALFVSFVVILAYDAGRPPVGDALLLVLVCAATGIVLAPLAALFAYGLRFATIAKRTTTFGTFTPPEEMP